MNRSVIPPLSKQRWIIILLLLVCIVVSLLLSVLPWFQMDFQTLAVHGDPDIWYNFRQIEVMVSDFPRYNWFDPMTAYPVGKELDWGPLSPLFASLLCLIGGAVQLADIMAVSSWMPVVAGIAMIPVVFFLGRLIAGWKAGIIAAVFIAFVSGEYFYRTMAGIVDHHALEILFSTLFCLFYLWALRRSSEHGIDIRNPASLKPVLFPSLLAGISMGFGMAVMPTLILFGLIVVLYSTVQYCWSAFHEKRSDSLLLLNGAVSLGAIAGLAVVGIHSPVYSLSTYSAAPFHAFIALFCWTLILQIFSMATKHKPWYFIGLLCSSIAVALIVAAVVDPSLISSWTGSISTFFGQSFSAAPIEELKPWSPGQMWASYNIAIILGFVGFALFAYSFWKKDCPLYLYSLVWGIVLLIATIQHSRYEYYSAVIIVIAATFTLASAFSLDKPGKPKNNPFQHKNDPKSKKEKKRAKEVKKNTSEGLLADLEGTGTSLVLACMIVFCGFSLLADYSIAVPLTKEDLIPRQWTGVLEWAAESSPDPGVSYLGSYGQGDQWSYPEESYGVLSWWDYGHWITVISRRIPVTNPFQDNLVPSAMYFFADSEENANAIADNYRVKYVITDWKMVESKFPAMVAFYDSSLDDQSLPADYYYQVFRITSPDKKGNQTLARFHASPFYHTMVSRLHSFDGSMAAPQTVMYVEYDIPASARTTPGISVYENLDPETAREKIALFNATPHEGRRAAILNTGLDTPVETIPALRHYRLVYEEAEVENETSPSYTQAVKAFEYVKGARLKGDGEIEVTIQTNLGRTFVYHQQSENGSFILPYPTKGSQYPVHTLGPYRMISSGRTVDVAEQDVLEGKVITG